jgi:hypothetical protein
MRILLCLNGSFHKRATLIAFSPESQCKYPHFSHTCQRFQAGHSPVFLQEAETALGNGRRHGRRWPAQGTTQPQPSEQHGDAIGQRVVMKLGHAEEPSGHPTHPRSQHRQFERLSAFGLSAVVSIRGPTHAATAFGIGTTLSGIDTSTFSVSSFSFSFQPLSRSSSEGTLTSACFAYA